MAQYHLCDMGDSFYVNIFYWKGGFDEFLIKLLECSSAKRGKKTCIRQISPNSSHEINLGRVHEILTSNCMTHTIVANCIEKSLKIYFHI